ncbi:TPA: phage tail protein [Escherichia coli]|nr:phage tail protein [Escherichia coli]HBA9327548.1 phage tail protein [Escherichia coli]HBA9377717.1 phage tail protein [Escherichia coli]
MPDKGAFIDNVGLRDTVNKAANALPSNGTAVAANRLANARKINGVAFDGTQDITISSGTVTGIRLGSVTRYGKNNWETWDLNLGGGNVLTGITVQDVGKNSADNIAGVYYRSVQYLLNGAWVTAASI